MVSKELEILRHIFEKYSNRKFHANSSFESRVVQCGVTDRQTDRAKLIEAFGNLAHAPNNYSVPI